MLLESIPNHNTAPNHFTGKSQGFTLTAPIEGSLYIGTSLIKDNPIATHRLTFLYNDVAMKLLRDKHMLWTTEGRPYVRGVPPNLYGYKDIVGIEDKLTKEGLLLREMKGFPKSLAQKIIIVGTGETVEKVLSGAASHAEYLENQRFVTSMINLSELHFNETPDVWLNIIDHLETNIMKKDCGISTLCESVPGTKGLSQQLSDKKIILERFTRFFGE